MTDRAMRSQKIVRCTGRSQAIVECLTCGCQHIVDRDEDGDAEVEMWPCEGSDDCVSMLCPDCKTVCPLCGNNTCADHIETVAGERMCIVCKKSLADEGLCHSPEAA